MGRDVTSRDGTACVRHHWLVDTIAERGLATAEGAGLSRRVLVASAPVLAGVLLVCHVAAATFGGRVALGSYVDRFLLFALVGALAFGALGSIVARTQPGNALALIATGIGWGFGLSVGLDVVGTAGALRGAQWASWAVWVAQWVWPPAMLAIPTLLILRFPDGRLSHRRWRFVEQMALAGLVLIAIQWALMPYGVMDIPPVAGVANPVAQPALGRLAGWGLPLVVAAVVGSLTAFVMRYARSDGVERAQLQWVVLGLFGAVTVVCTAILIGSEAAPLSSLGIMLLPACIGVAVLRHRLWDVRLVIDRSLTYGLVSVAILVVYAATVEILAGLLGRTTGAPLAATGLVAVAVLPLRDWAQRLVVGLRYGDRGDPYAALGRLGTQLEAAGDRAALLADVTEAIARAMRLRGAAIVVDGEVIASSGESGSAPFEVPLTVRGDRVGTLLATPRAGDELTGADRRLLADLARHVAQSLHAEQLHAELEASRAQLVTAREEERRRIRGDLHDELGPTLSAAALAVEQAAYELGSASAEITTRLDDTAERLRGTVRHVRLLVEGLRPATLDELGLEGAVRELTRRLAAGGLRIDVVVDGELDELPAAVDLAAYRIIGEAVTNVVRHADAASCQVTLRRRPDRLEVVTDDDGRGVAGDARPGIGRNSMQQRAAELGGVCVTSPRPSGGTQVRVSLPVAAP